MTDMWWGWHWLRTSGSYLFCIFLLSIFYFYLEKIKLGLLLNIFIRLFPRKFCPGLRGFTIYFVYLGKIKEGIK